MPNLKDWADFRSNDPCLCVSKTHSSESKQHDAAKINSITVIIIRDLQANTLPDPVPDIRDP